jgi:hypothetical protein
MNTARHHWRQKAAAASTAAVLTVSLATAATAAPARQCHVVFDDAASTPFASVTSTLAPFTGTWRPSDPLAPLRLAPVDGNWTLSVVDNAGLDTGSVRAVSLPVTGFVH